MEHRHYHFEGRLVQLLVFVDGDASAVVLNGNRVVFVDSYFDVGTEAGHGFVDGVVDGLVDEVVEAFFAYVADVHGGTLAHGL